MFNFNSIITCFQTENLPDIDYFSRPENYDVEGSFISPMKKMLETHDYKPVNDREVEAHNVTIYEPRILKEKIVIYVPGFGRNFTLFHLNRDFKAYGVSLVGVDLHGYGYTYFHNRPPRYNGYDQVKFDANLNYVLRKYKNNTITLMGNSTGSTIITHYLNKYSGSHPSIEKVVLTSPVIPNNTLSKLPHIPFLNEIIEWGATHIPDLIIANDPNPPEFPYINEPVTKSDFLTKTDRKFSNWIHVYLQQYNNSSPLHKISYDPRYSPLRNKSVTIRQVYYITKNTNIEFSTPTLLILADNPLFEEHIDVKAYKMRQWPANVHSVFLKDGFHETLASDKETVAEAIRLTCG